MTNKEWLDYLAHNAPDELAAWFDAERVTNQAEMLDMPESPTSATMQHIGQVIEDTVKRGVYGDTEPHDADSREQLEADIRQYANPEGNTGTLGACWERKMFEFLDRQAAITRQECLDTRVNFAERVCMGNKIDELTDERDRLRRQVDMLNGQVVELTGERDELKEEIAKYEHDCGLLFDEKHKLTADAQKWADAANAQRLVAIEQADKVQELTAERNEWKAKAEGYAEALEKLGCSVLANGTVFPPPTYNEADSRVKLEADIERYLSQAGCHEMVCGWLDRQAAITLAKDEAYCQECNGDYYKLQDERDELQAQVDTLKSRHCPHYHVNEHTCDVHETRIAELTAERDKAREESVELYSDLVKASDEREHYREKCSKMATIIHDALMVMDEGMA